MGFSMRRRMRVGVIGVAIIGALGVVAGVMSPAHGDELNSPGPGQEFQTIHRVTPEGTQTLFALRAPSAPERFLWTFPLQPGEHVVISADGKRASVVDQRDRVVGLTRPARAVDANGRTVSTHFESDGTNLIQVVEHRTANYAYPIVADPDWIWYSAAWGAKFSQAETKKLAANGGSLVMCGVRALMAPPLGAACAIAGGQWFWQAQRAADEDGCVFIAAVPAPLAVRYLGKDCR